MADLKTSLRIDAQTSGQDKVEGLRQALIGLGVSADQAEAMASGIADELAQLGPRKKAVEDLRQAFIALGLSEQEAEVAVRQTVNELDRLDDKQQKVAKSGIDLAGSIKALAGAAVVKEFLDINASLESMEQALVLVTGSQEAARREMAFVADEANRLGLEVVSATQSYVQFAGATKGTNLEGEKTREIWSSVAESISRLGGTAADVSGALTQLAQGVSKGKFELEDLKSVAERIPGFFEIAARAIGVTTQGFMAMQSSGQLLVDDFLPKLANELNKLSSGGGEINTFNAQINRAKTSLGELAKAIGDTGLFDAISWGIGKAANATSVLANESGLLWAKITGNDEAVKRYSERLLDAAQKLYGLKDGSQAAGQALEKMGGQAKVAANQIEQEIGQKIQRAILGLQGDVAKTQVALDALGVDPSKITDGIDQAQRKIIDMFKALAADPNIDGQVLLGSLLSALDKVTKEAVPELMFAYKSAANQGRQSTDELAAGLDAARAKIEAAESTVVDLEAAYQDLGLVSKAALDDMAGAARQAYETLVAGKAPAEDLRLAWLEYAQAAMDAAQRAGEGQAMVTRATLEAEAAAKGYIVTISEDGDVVGQTLAEWAERYYALLEAQDKVSSAAQDSALAVAQASSEMNGFGQSHNDWMQNSINSFHEMLKGIGEGMAYVINSMRQHIADLTSNSDAAARAFEAALNQRAGSVGAYIDKVAREVNVITRMYKEQVAQLNAEIAQLETAPLVDSLERAELHLQALENDAESTTRTLNMLGEEDISRLRAAIEDARQRMQALHEMSRDALASVQDEFDQYFGNLDELERRRSEQKLAELRAKLAEAEAEKNLEAVKRLREAIRLYEQLSNARIQDAREEEAARKARGETSRTPTDTRGGYDSGGSRGLPPIEVVINGYTDENRLADRLLPVLKSKLRLSA